MDLPKTSEPYSIAETSARDYFARLSLQGQTRAVLSRWHSLSAATYFVALRLPYSVTNAERNPCAVGIITLGELFQGLGSP